MVIFTGNLAFNDLKRAITEDDVYELSKCLRTRERHKFNTAHKYPQKPLLHIAVKANSEKVLEYLLSQNFIYYCVRDTNGKNIYHVVCSKRGAEQLFSLIERTVPHQLLFNYHFSHHFKKYPIHTACEKNNVFIVKRVYEKMESSQVDLTEIKNSALKYAVRNKDIEVIKYVLSIDGIQLNDDILLEAMGFLKFDIVVFLLNVYLCQSIPSHLHNQFHIFQFSNLHLNYNNNENDIKNGIANKNEIIINDNREVLICDNDNNDNYLQIVEENFKKIIDIKLYGNRIWCEVCKNANFDVVQLIFSLKGIQPEILNEMEIIAF